MIGEKHKLNEGGRRFQREGAIMAKDLDMTMVVLAYPWSVEDEGIILV